MAAESAWGAARPPGVPRNPVTVRRKLQPPEQKFHMVDEEDSTPKSAFQTLIPKINEQVQQGLERLAKLDRSNEAAFQAELYDYIRFRREASTVIKAGPEAHALLAKVLMDINARALGLPMKFEKYSPNYTAIFDIEKRVLQRKLVLASHEAALSEFASIPAHGIYQQEMAYIKDLIVNSKEAISKIELKITHYKTKLDQRNIPEVVSCLSEIDLEIANFSSQFNIHLAKLNNTPFTRSYLPILEKHYTSKGLKKDGS